MSALAFDPHAALAKIENDRALNANRANRANFHYDSAPEISAISAISVSVVGKPKIEAARWQARLAALDPARPLCGIAPARWRTLLADARWLADVHGKQAAALGWNASDLFGIDPMPGRGGLADRLHGARIVYIFADVATWERDGWRWGMVPLHRDLPPLWKLAGAARIRR